MRQQINYLWLFLKLNFVFHVLGWVCGGILAISENNAKQSYWALSYAFHFSRSYWWVYLFLSIYPFMIVRKNESNNGHLNSFDGFIYRWVCKL